MPRYYSDRRRQPTEGEMFPPGTVRVQSTTPGVSGAYRTADWEKLKAILRRKEQKKRAVRYVDNISMENPVLTIQRKEQKRRRTISGEKQLAQDLGVEANVPRYQPGSSAAVGTRREKIRKFTPVSVRPESPGVPITSMERRYALSNLDVQRRKIKMTEDAHKEMVKKAKALVKIIGNETRTLGDDAIDTPGEWEAKLKKIFPGIDTSDPAIQKVIIDGSTPGAVDTTSMRYKAELSPQRISQLENAALNSGVDMNELYRGRMDRQGRFMGTTQQRVELLQGALTGQKKRVAGEKARIATQKIEAATRKANKVSDAQQYNIDVRNALTAVAQGGQPLDRVLKKLMSEYPEKAAKLQIDFREALAALGYK